MSNELLAIPLNAGILAQMSPEAKAPILHLLERVAKLETQYASLLKRFEKLKIRLMRNVDNMWTFLCTWGVSPANNASELSLRFLVTYRKFHLKFRQKYDKFFIERIMPLRQTRRIQKRRIFPVLIDSFLALFNRTTPDILFVSGLIL